MERQNFFELSRRYVDGKGVSRETWEKAKAACQYASSCGDSQALLELGFVFEDGIAVNQDESAAQAFFERAADLNNPYGFFHLGRLLKKRGQISSALDCWQKARALGDPLSCAHIGVAYLNGDGVDQNLKIAVQLFEESAHQNNLEGIYFLGVCYRDGSGVEASLDMAIKLFQKGWELGDERSPLEIAKLFHYRRLKVDSAKQMALEYVRESAEMGSQDAKLWLEQSALSKSCNSLVPRGLNSGNWRWSFCRLANRLRKSPKKVKHCHGQT